MKKSLMLAGALMISTFIFAQNDAAGPEGHHGPRRGRGNGEELMKTELSLDDAQYSSIKEINKKYGEKHRALFKDSTMKRDDKFKAHKDLNDQRQSEINKVLTPEQNTKWSALKKARMEKRKAAGEKRMKARQERVQKYDEKLKKELNLSDEQFKKLQDMHKKDREEFRKRHNKK